MCTFRSNCRRASYGLDHVPSDEHQYCNKNSATPGATNFTSSTWGSYNLGGDSDVYIIDAMV